MMIKKVEERRWNKKKLEKQKWNVLELIFSCEKMEGGKGLTRNFKKSSKIKRTIISHFFQKYKKENKKEERKMAEREKGRKRKRKKKQHFSDASQHESQKCENRSNHFQDTEKTKQNKKK